ncbi:unnamed protein product, partial [Discosporangium mesarthrocarpum]
MGKEADKVRALSTDSRAAVGDSSGCGGGPGVAALVGVVQPRATTLNPPTIWPGAGEGQLQETVVGVEIDVQGTGPQPPQLVNSNQGESQRPSGLPLPLGGGSLQGQLHVSHVSTESTLHGEEGSPQRVLGSMAVGASGSDLESTSDMVSVASGAMALNVMSDTDSFTTLGLRPGDRNYSMEFGGFHTPISGSTGDLMATDHPLHVRKGQTQTITEEHRQRPEHELAGMQHQEGEGAREGLGQLMRHLNNSSKGQEEHDRLARAVINRSAGDWVESPQQPVLGPPPVPAPGEAVVAVAGRAARTAPPDIVPTGDIEKPVTAEPGGEGPPMYSTSNLDSNPLTPVSDDGSGVRGPIPGSATPPRGEGLIVAQLEARRIAEEQTAAATEIAAGTETLDGPGAGSRLSGSASDTHKAMQQETLGSPRTFPPPPVLFSPGTAPRGPVLSLSGHLLFPKDGG